MRGVGAVAPPMRHGPLFLDGHSRRAEEQLAFQDKYHDRMARLTGGGADENYAAWGLDEPRGGLREPAPDYWAEYAKKLEHSGLPRLGDDSSRAKAAAQTQSPPPRGSFDSPPDMRPSPGRWETYSATKSPARLPEESVLHRLDWLAQEKSEPNSTEVIDLLREVEEVLEHEGSQRRDESRVEVRSPLTGASATSCLPASRLHDPGRPMGVPPAPPIPTKAATVSNTTTNKNNNMDANLTSTSRCRTAPPATTPTAAPSFQHVSQGASSGAPLQGADWSQVSRCQQMEWYRTYYAWMMYYAQYYGSLLASQQQQHQHQQKEKEKVLHKNSNKQQTNLKELSREYKKLALEVERLSQSFWSHASAKESASTQSPCRDKMQRKGRRRPPPLHPGEDEYTLYRSDRGHSSLLVPSHYSDSAPPDDEEEGPILAQTTPAAAASKAGLGPRARLRRDSLGRRGELARGASQLDAPEKVKAFYGRRSDMPWLPPQRQSPDANHAPLAPRPTGRDISWLYKYEESEAEKKSRSDTDEEGAWGRDDEEQTSDPPLSQEGGSALPPSSSRYDFQGPGRQKEGRSSVYERRRRELEQEKPRWCF
ncbi:uncharacterized protein Tco025E_07085 [Trypanosoma conorhini]|uniref:Uncharacterized protein n=1 Tax=Trypanosoma conorhini TaxID=83891 RepID=A0A422NTN6_9TRYP|nr:uncharacterized protein Tco025E_07085 [Trypanosoma conorhini]RNF08828.1 hypothetical protein Tco025E_07085 [Trypanosoma conorhini]